MGQPEPSEFLITLHLAEQGQKQAARELLPLVYEELRKVAAVRLVGVKQPQTLQPTALVHEAFIRLVGSGDPGWNGKRHFFGAAAQAMRNILVDRARQKAALKNGGSGRRVSLEAIENNAELEIEQVDFVGLDAALSAFELVSPEATQVVMLRYFAGLSEADAARLMGRSVTTVRRRWIYAKAWLHRKLAEESN